MVRQETVRLERIPDESTKFPLLRNLSPKTDLLYESEHELNDVVQMMMV